MTKRYTVQLNARPVITMSVVVCAQDDGDAFDKAGEIGAEVCPYHFTMSITNVEEIDTDT